MTVAEHAPGMMAETEAGPREGVDLVLLELEERHTRLCEELAGLEVRLRRLRTAANLCPMCGGVGLRWVRGGMYGEMQERVCPCADPGGI